MTPAQRLTDRKREAIVQAAVAEFRTHGFEATSMDKVAATAEVSKRTLYNHFASKEDLFAEILMQLWHRSASQVELAYRADEPLREQLLALMLQKLAMLSSDDFIDDGAAAVTEVAERVREEFAQRIGIADLLTPSRSG